MATVASSVKALNAYLKHSKGVFLKHHVTKAAGNVRNARMLHVVMGNEALDLDSTVSSVLLANLYHHYYMDIDELSDGLVAVDVLPVLPVERRDFVLRQDAFSLLERVGVDLASLLFIDDVPPPTNSLKSVLLACQSAGQLRLTLTDHNRLSMDWDPLNPSVVGIVDHHVDQSIPSHVTLSQERQIIVPLGSASTLVAERYLGTSPLPSFGNSDFDPSSLLDPAIGSLLVGTILIDTVNLDPKFGRTEPRDVQAVDAIVRHINECGDKFGLHTVDERNALFQYLQDIKFDLSRLTSPELLRKDYKSWRVAATSNEASSNNEGIKYGISAVTMSIADWVAKDSQLPATFAQYMKEQGISLFIAMTSYTDQDKVFHREAIFTVLPGHESLLTHISNDIAESLTLSQVPIPNPLTPHEGPIVFFSQKDVKLSRKQLQPAVHDSIQKFLK